MGSRRVPTILTALTCSVLFLIFSGSPASAQVSQPLNSQDQYEDQIVRVNGLDELAELGINGPEDFDYCDAEGCYILGPTDKEFFSCDPNWQCEYSIWPSSALSAEDFDYFESLYRADSTTPEDEVYSGYGFGEYGYAYACGSGEVCLNVATYQCTPSGDCEYYTNIGVRQEAGGGDVVPSAGRDANRAYDAFRRALENSPSATRTALASDDTVTSGAPPVSGDSARSGNPGQPNSGPDAESDAANNGGGNGSDQDDANGNGGNGDASGGSGSNGGSPEQGSSGAGGSEEQAPKDSGPDPERGNAGAGEADSASSGSSDSTGGSSFLSSAGPQSIVLGVGALALLAGGAVLAVRLLRS